MKNGSSWLPLEADSNVSVSNLQRWNLVMIFSLAAGGHSLLYFRWFFFFVVLLLTIWYSFPEPSKVPFAAGYPYRGWN